MLYVVNITLFTICSVALPLRMELFQSSYIPSSLCYIREVKINNFQCFIMYDRSKILYECRANSRKSKGFNSRISYEPELLIQSLVIRGGARGGLGGYSPHRSMLATHWKVKSDFFGDFWHL